jgi:hypothetical protein
MKYEIILIIAVALITFLFLASALKKAPKVRYAFIVPEGYAGLLYQHGKFVEQLAPGRHVRWGRSFHSAHRTRARRSSSSPARKSSRLTTLA